MVAALVEAYPDEFWLSRSWTTREQRPGEDDDAYVFVDRDTFTDHIEAGGFLEFAEFLGNYYGTPVPEPPSDRDLILEIDVQGARQVVAIEPDALLIFLSAPSAEEQEARLRHRGDPEEKVAERLAKAREEAHAGAELGASHITNVDIGATVEQMMDVIRAARDSRVREA